MARGLVDIRLNPSVLIRSIQTKVSNNNGLPVIREMGSRSQSLRTEQVNSNTAEVLDSLKAVQESQSLRTEQVNSNPLCGEWF